MDEPSQQGAPEGAPRDLPEGAQEAMQGFQDCLADEGVELPQPGDPSDGGGQPQLSDEQREAFEQCQGELPSGAGPGVQ